ncbi:MAG: MFS transporter [Bryobacteraceae bacterium]
MRGCCSASPRPAFSPASFYLSHWFTFEDRSRAKAYFMMTQPLAIVVGVPLSRWILGTVHWHGLAGWRWVFILEGLPCIVMGFVTLFYLTDQPSDARWLSAEEKTWLTGQLQNERLARTAARRVRISEVFRNPQVLRADRGHTADRPVESAAGKADPISSDWRRDVGIWAAILALVHTAIGQDVHLRGRPWLYYVYEHGSRHVFPLQGRSARSLSCFY